MINLVGATGHDILFRPPYCPAIAPIEYFFNQVQCSLRGSFTTQPITTQAELYHAVTTIIGNLGGFETLGY